MATVFTYIAVLCAGFLFSYSSLSLIFPYEGSESFGPLKLLAVTVVSTFTLFTILAPAQAVTEEQPCPETEVETILEDTGY